MRHPAVTEAAQVGSPAILIKNGSFAWEAGGVPLLRHLSLEVPAGRLLVVIGEVGSGGLMNTARCALHSLRLYPACCKKAFPCVVLFLRLCAALWAVFV